MKILITSGGTKVPIDMVRSITNMSAGTFATRIANEYLKIGHEVLFIKAKGSKTPLSINIDLKGKMMSLVEYEAWLEQTEKLIDRYFEHEYVTYDDYSSMLKFIISAEKPDIIILAAAVSDYGVENYHPGKLRSNDMLTIKLRQLPKLISYIKDLAPKVKLIGFKMLVNSKLPELLTAAARSMEENKCDMVVANDLQDIKDGNHQVHLVFPDKNTVTYKTDDKDPDYLAKMVVKHSFQI